MIDKISVVALMFWVLSACAAESPGAAAPELPVDLEQTLAADSKLRLDYDGEVSVRSLKIGRPIGGTLDAVSTPGLVTGPSVLNITEPVSENAYVELPDGFCVIYEGNGVWHLTGSGVVTDLSPIKGLGITNLYVEAGVTGFGDHVFEDLDPLLIVGGEQDGEAVKTAASLNKTGEGTLSLDMPLRITGATEVKAGTLRFGRKIPAYPSGLKWTYQKVDQGIDPAGLSYAYKAWPTAQDPKYVYDGFIRVPGEEGASVTCNWMSSIARGCKVTIDGVVCAEFSDNKNVKDNINVGFNRLAMYQPVTLKAGWRSITVVMNNWYNSTRGPQDNTALGWPANFAIGVDWQARCVTNASYYAKLLDPGDGSFLVASTNATDKLVYSNADDYRPTFHGSVAFSAGATLDLGDYEPYAALTIPSLTGLPTITNGAVKVTSAEWTLRADDIVAGRPLTVAANAELLFGSAGSTVTVTGDGEAWHEAIRFQPRPLSITILHTDGERTQGNDFVLDASLAKEGWTLAKAGGDLVLGFERGKKVDVGEGVNAYVEDGTCVVSAADGPLVLTAVHANALREAGVTNLVIGAGVTGLADGAFTNCKTLRSVALGEDCKVIGAKAFHKCYNLTNVTSLAEQPVLGDCAFLRCNGLRTLSFAAMPINYADVEMPFAFHSEISMRNGIPEVSAVPDVIIGGYRQVLRGSKDLVTWEDVTTETQRAECRFFKIELRTE